MPMGAVSVTRPGKWGNKWRIQDGFTLEESLRIYKEWAFDHRDQIQRELSGKDLACWCKEGQPCHADVLLEIANY
jgi:hypothetical protein